MRVVLPFILTQLFGHFFERTILVMTFKGRRRRQRSPRFRHQNLEGRRKAGRGCSPPRPPRQLRHRRPSAERRERRNSPNSVGRRTKSDILLYQVSKFLRTSQASCGLYYKHIKIVNDTSSHQLGY
jgi:hypothetical protein